MLVAISDIGRIVYAFRQWCGEPAPALWDQSKYGEWLYRDIPGFCNALRRSKASRSKASYSTTTGRYVGIEERKGDEEPFSVKFPRILVELEDSFAEGERLTEEVRRHLSGLQYYA